MHSVGIHRRSDRQTDTQTDTQTLVTGPTAKASWPTILILTYDSDLQSHASYCHDLLTYDCESWTLRKNEETLLEVFEMKELKKGFCVFRGQQRKQMSGFSTTLE